MAYAKTYSFLVWVCLMSTIGLSIPCMAEKTLVFGGLADSQPLSFEENGAVTGFFSDVFHEVAQRAGYNITLRLYPVKRLEVYLKSGEIDGTVTLSHTLKREAYLIYSATPVMTSRTLVFVKKGLEFPFNGINDLAGKNIGVLLGWKVVSQEFERAIQDGTIHTDPVSDHDQNLKKLMGGRIDCLIDTEQLTWHHAHKLGIAKDIVALEMPLNEISVYFAITKNSKNITAHQAFMKSMNDALDSVISDGTYGKLKKKYSLL